MSRRPPIDVVGLFREVDRHLLVLLRSLAPDDWHKPTTSSQRCVKDIAAHLLDGSVRRLSFQRDGYLAPNGSGPFVSVDELTQYLHRLNAEWTTATRRISPRLLIEWLESTGEELAALFEGLDPFAPAVFPVAWAGEEESANWFDLAREYTEKWHHAQQIFESVGRPSPLLARSLYRPVLDTFMRALPFAFRDADAPEGTNVRVVVTGDAGGEWWVRRFAGRWEPMATTSGTSAATVTLPPEVAWKVWTKRRSVAEKLRAYPGIRIDGDADLGERVIGMVSVMA